MKTKAPPSQKRPKKPERKHIDRTRVLKAIWNEAQRNGFVLHYKSYMEFVNDYSYDPDPELSWYNDDVASKAIVDLIARSIREKVYNQIRTDIFNKLGKIIGI